MLRKLLFFFLVTSCFGQVTKPVQVYSVSGQLQWPPTFFMTNVFAAGGTTLSFDSLGRMTISSVSGSGTNTLFQTNGVSIGQAGTVNWTTGVTGYLAGAVANLGVSVSPSGGGAAVADLLVVSNQLQTASNKFQTDVSNLQGATNSFNPGGNSGAIQFKEGGAFAGTNEFVFDRTNKYARLVGSGSRFAVEFAGLGTNWISSVFMISTNQGNQALQLGVVNIGVPNGLAIQSNSVTPMISTLSNHTDFGNYILPWRTNYAEWYQAKQGISLGTNGSSFTAIRAASFLWLPTNVFVFTVTNPSAGQVLKINSVNISGGIATIILTNDTDNTGGGGSLQTNENQFGANTMLTVKEGAKFTNIYAYNHIVLSNESLNFTLSTNHLAIGRDSYGGRALLESWDDQGLSIAYQPFLGNNRIHMILPGTTATTVGGYGMVTPVSLGGVTISQPAPTEEWPLMLQLATPATSNACAGVFTSTDMTTMGTRYGHNGYFIATEFMSTNLLVTNLQAPAGNRLFIGRTSTANPALTNIVNTTNATGQYAGLYCDSGFSAEFFLSVRDGTAEFRTNTGMFWRATNLYQFYMMQAPTSKFLTWKLKNLTAGIISEGWFSNNVPTNMMKAGYLIRNGTTVVHSVRFNKLYIEAPLSP